MVEQKTLAVRRGIVAVPDIADRDARADAVRPESLKSLIEHRQAALATFRAIMGGPGARNLSPDLGHAKIKNEIRAREFEESE